MSAAAASQDQTSTPTSWVEIIRTTRAQLKLSREAFAHRLGANVASVDNWEDGHFKPSKRFQGRILELARAAEVSVDAPPVAALPRRPLAGGLRLFSVFLPVQRLGRQVRRRVAEGVEFANGWCVLSWNRDDGDPEVGVRVYPSLADVARIHSVAPSDLVMREL